MKRIVILLLINIFTLHIAASPTHLDSLMRFAGNIHQFNSIYPQEKVYLQFDNTSYYSGDLIWFKAFVVKASTLQRAESGVLYVDLLSPGGVLLQQQKLKIVAGQANGCFQLVDQSTAQARSMRGIIGYPSGFYEIRAYTSNMLNFDNETLFSRVFAVYEPPKEEGDYYSDLPVIKEQRTYVEQYRPKSKPLADCNVTFYPEGGNLVIGKPCRVAFRASDATGFGTDIEGEVTGTNIKFHTLHGGMGSFVFTPEKRENSVTIYYNGKSQHISLPEAQLSGIALSVQSGNNGDIRVEIAHTDNFNNKTLGITLTCRGEVVNFGTIELNKKRTIYTIPSNEIPHGVCRITLFDNNGTIYAARSLFHHSRLKAPQITITPKQKKFEPFSPIELQINLVDGNNNPFRDRFCISVRDIRGFSNIYTDNISTSLLLSSDIKGFIENPEYYFERRDKEHDDALDLLMMVQGWERYDWQCMAGLKPFEAKHRIEEGITLNGWVLNPSGKKPLEGVTVLAAVVPENREDLEQFSLQTDKSGYFGFDIGVDFYNNAKLTIDTRVEHERLIGTSSRILLERSLRPNLRSYLPGEILFSTTRYTDKVKQIGNRGDVDIEADRHYPTIIKESEGYLLPDVNIEGQRKYIDYYTFKSFNVIKDVEGTLDKAEFSTDIFNYLINKGYQVYVDLDSDSVYIDGYPAFFYVHNNSKYVYQGRFEKPLQIDTKDTRSVLVYDKVITLGEAFTLSPLYEEHLRKTLFIPPDYEFLQQRVRLVDINLKEEHELNSRKELIDISRRITTLAGYSEPYSFYSPSYPDGPILGDVDYRRTLYWNPNVITDSNGEATIEFYNNSNTSNINISAAGITAVGQPYSFDQNF